MLGPLMIDLEGCELTAVERDLLRHPLVGGVILFSRNYADPGQLAALTAAVHAVREPRLLIAVDQEGGRVQRFRGAFSQLPALARLGEAYARDPAAALALAADCASLMAAELRAVGVDFSFAPVLDLQDPRSAVIGDRAFDPDPRVVARLAHAYVTALHQAGVAAVGKHFPGHGGVAGDSHVELPVDRRDYVDLEQADLLPFRALIAAGIEGLMTAHVLYPGVDDVVATYSPHWLRQILRLDLGFEGAIFSDDLGMAAAAPGSYPERAERALDAGCDVLLLCNQRAGVCAVLDALPGLHHPQTQVRLMRMHGRGTPQGLATLQETAAWRALARRVERSDRFPELDLGDDSLLG
jgi:beta-N-acetylhexosaminidase